MNTALQATPHLSQHWKCCYCSDPEPSRCSPRRKPLRHHRRPSAPYISVQSLKSPRPVESQAVSNPGILFCGSAVSTWKHGSPHLPVLDRHIPADKASSSHTSPGGRPAAAPQAARSDTSSPATARAAHARRIHPLRRRVRFACQAPTHEGTSRPLAGKRGAPDQPAKPSAEKRICVSRKKVGGDEPSLQCLRKRAAEVMEHRAEVRRAMRECGDEAREVRLRIEARRQREAAVAG